MSSIDLPSSHPIDSEPLAAAKITKYTSHGGPRQGVGCGSRSGGLRPPGCRASTAPAPIPAARALTSALACRCGSGAARLTEHVKGPPTHASLFSLPSRNAPLPPVLLVHSSPLSFPLLSQSLTAATRPITAAVTHRTHDLHTPPRHRPSGLSPPTNPAVWPGKRRPSCPTQSSTMQTSRPRVCL